jgi:hypothetical protein
VFGELDLLHRRDLKGESVRSKDPPCQHTHDNGSLERTGILSALRHVGDTISTQKGLWSQRSNTGLKEKE